MKTDPFAHRPRRSWRRVTVEVPAELAEEAAALVVEASGSGVECASLPAEAGAAPRERVVGYLAEGAGADGAERGLREAIGALVGRARGGSSASVRTEPLLEEDWGASWKEHFRPFAVSRSLVVKPTWEAYAPRPGEVVIEMDPGMAFGTGLHASTRLALALLEERCAAAPRRALDLGTGTGILAMAIALWGAGEVTALDSDPDAVAAARENVARNRLGDRVRVGGEELAAAAGTFDLVVANITADVLEALADALLARLAPGGALVLSGILAGEQARGVRAVYERCGLAFVDERAEGEWAALSFTKPGMETGTDLFSEENKSVPVFEELFELVDETGRVIGRAPRRACHGNPALLHRSVHVVVVDGAGRLYLQKRSLAKDIQPGRWDTSVGGHLEPGEDHLAAAHREMREELGLEGAVRPLYRYLWRTDRESELVATFLHLAQDEPRPDPREVDEGRWFTRPEVDALVGTGVLTPNLEEELRRLADAGIF